MIQPSQRRRRDARDHAFDLHDRLARSEAWHRKLSVAGVASLAASVAAWLLGLELAWHAGAVAVGFAGGLVWPARDAEERAFGWIAERAGLVYETALQTPGADPYGLHGAVEERARAAAARLRFPTRQRWWMASLALALGLLLLPAARSVAPTGTAGGPEGPNVTAPVVPEPEDEAAEVDEPEQPADLDRAADPDDRSGDDAGEGTADGGPSRATEEETLSRFLDNLRERDPFNPVETPQTPEEAAPRSEPSETPPGEPEAGEGRPQGSGDEEQGDVQEDGSSREGEGESQEGDEQGDQGRPEEGSEEGDSEGAPGPDPGEGEGTEQQEAPAAGLEPGDEEGEPQPDAADGAGADPSSLRPSAEAEGETQEDPEFLQGQLDAGPENPGGSVLLPGETDVDVPPELRTGDYRRAVEEAVTDGQVPLEYQEIIRKYFR